jgi:hypothetical protein
MKKIFFVAAVVTLMTGCDNTYDQIAKISVPPVVFFNSTTTTTTLTDSLKISLKTGQDDYSFSITGNGKESPVKEITFTLEGGTGHLKNGGLELQKDLGPLTNGQRFDLSFYTDNVGELKFVFTGRNEFGATGSATLNLLVFNNFPPVAKFVANPFNQNQFGKYSYQFDGTASHDKDKRFGGIVKTYKYTITSNNYGTQTILNDSPLTSVVFPGPGAFTVSLIAYDNDGEPSAVYTLPQPITLQ